MTMNPVGDFGVRPDFNRPADQLRRSLADRVDKIRANTSLTQIAKTAQIARETIAAKARMAELEAASQADQAAAMKKATAAAFGTQDLTRNAKPAEVVTIQASHRDALARVADVVDSDQLKRTLQQADDTGDELLARAVGRQAFSLGAMGQGQDVVDAYAATRPVAAEAIRTLTTPETNIGKLLEFALPLPSEVGGTANDYSLAQLAESDAPANAGGS